MKNILPFLSAMAVLVSCTATTAQDAAGHAPAVKSGAGPEATGPSTGDKLLAQAINQFERHRSVTARIRHQATIGGVPLYGVGSYWQQGSGDSLRVRMELQIAGLQSSLLEVSNSRYLWTDRRLPSGRTVTAVDLRQLRGDPVLSSAELDSIRPGEASWSPIQPEITANCGGLASVLAALSDNFAFLPPQAMQLALEPPLVTQAMRIPVYAVVGHWKPEKLAALTSAPHESKSEEKNDPARHNDRVPQEVLLLLGQADLFPYRIEYRRLETPRATTPDGAAVPYQLSAEPLVVLELSDVTFDVPIDGGQFDYSPKDVEWVDQTAKLLERLRKRRQAEVAARGVAAPK